MMKATNEVQRVRKNKASILAAAQCCHEKRVEAEN
jgi:hypothetical protein